MISNRQLFLRHLAQTSPAPLALEIERASGSYLYDQSGKAYLDLIAGIGVSALGHRHPEVEEAVKNQLEKYWHTLVYGEFVLSPQVQLASLLSQQLPGLDSVYLVNSGAEATEGAMKLAKRYTGRPNIVAARYSYHGSTQGAASLMSPPEFTLPFHPLLPGIKHLDFNVMEGLELIDRTTAAVIIETVQAERGIYKPKPAWIQALRKRCTEMGALLILDEIQAGYGRTGSLFAFEQFDIKPDILLLAKGFGGGMPIGAFIAPKHIMQTLSHDPVLGHITTFGGHPVCAAAALKTLQILLESDLIAQVPAKSQLFLDLLKHPAIREIRSAGLWMAVELGSFDRVQQVIQHALKNGLITDWFLFNSESLRIAPPLTISEPEIREACRILLEAMDTL
jgi:acetylornithine/succinyldiaminopimelate/putrescine aminotransferase